VRGFDALVEFINIACLVDITKFFLDRLDLLIQIVLTLTLLHLALDATTDAFLYLQDIDLGFHEAHQMIQTRLQVSHLQDGLLLLQLQRQMCGDGIGQTSGIIDTSQRGQDFRGNLLVEFDVVVELRQQCAPHCLDFRVFVTGLRQLLAACQEVRVGFDEFFHRDTQIAFNQHFHGAIGQFQHLQNAGDCAYLIQVIKTGLILGGRLLRHQEDVFAALHGDFQRLDRLGAANKQWNHHVREYHHVAQWQQRQGNGISELGDLAHGFLRQSC